ncbi:MAG: hypothetical protein U9R69_04010 [Thermodesulfobacteriota bacterium]|nr:hypothetical protein [Thermodesulfobacteriota bacterium]
MNPYMTLEIDGLATKKEIIVAAATALRKRKFTGHEIVNAQKLLLDPRMQPIVKFLYQVDFKALKEGIVATKSLAIASETSANLKRLTLFDAE